MRQKNVAFNFNRDKQLSMTHQQKLNIVETKKCSTYHCISPFKHIKGHRLCAFKKYQYWILYSSIKIKSIFPYFKTL
jgi:hypothetical protein